MARRYDSRHANSRCCRPSWTRAAGVFAVPARRAALRLGRGSREQCGGSPHPCAAAQTRRQWVRNLRGALATTSPRRHEITAARTAGQPARRHRGGLSSAESPPTAWRGSRSTKSWTITCASSRCRCATRTSASPALTDRRPEEAFDIVIQIWDGPRPAPLPLASAHRAAGPGAIRLYHRCDQRRKLAGLLGAAARPGDPGRPADAGAQRHGGRRGAARSARCC